MTNWSSPTGPEFINDKQKIVKVFTSIGKNTVVKRYWLLNVALDVSKDLIRICN